MMLDVETLFSDDQDLAQDAGTYDSTNAILQKTGGTIPGLGGTAKDDIGDGGQAKVLCQITETFTSAGAATLAVSLVYADDAALDTNVVTVQSTGTIALASLVAGYEFAVGGTIPRGRIPAGKYLGLNYVIGTATTTAGKVTAGLVIDK